MKRTILIGVLMLLALITGQSVKAGLSWCGNSFFFIGTKATATWYTGSNSYTQPSGKLDGANLGAISTLLIGGEVQTYDATNGTSVSLKYKLDQVATEHSINVDWNKNEGNNQVWQSTATTDILIGENLTPGVHTAQFWYHANNGTINVYDNNTDKNYTVTFTVPGLVMPETSLAFATNIEVGAIDEPHTINLEGYGLVAGTPVVLALSGADAKDFTLSATSIVLSADKGSFTVNFTPQSQGIKSATVTATYGSYTKSFEVTGTAIAAAKPTIAIAPTTYTFPKQAVGTTHTTILTVTGLLLTDEITVSGKMDPFTVTPTLTTTGGTIEIAYSPISAGSHTMSLTLASGKAKSTIDIHGSAAVPITTRFKVPEEWGATFIYLYTNVSGNDVPYKEVAWPGVAINTVNGWCSYTLPVEVVTMDIIFNNSDTTAFKKKTADIKGVTASANYITTGVTTPGDELKYEVSTTDYPGATAINWDVAQNGGDVKVAAGGSLTIPNTATAEKPAIVHDITLPTAPSITISNGGKLIVTGDITLTTDGAVSSEIINEGTMSLLGKIRVKVTIAELGQWQFVSIPFDIAKVYKADGITEAVFETDYYINVYDGEKRATGTTAWAPATKLEGFRNFTVATESEKALVFESIAGATDIDQISKAGTVTLAQNAITTGGGSDDGGWNLITHPSLRSATPAISDHKLYLYNAEHGYNIVDNNDNAPATQPFQSYFVKYTKTEAPFNLDLTYNNPIAKAGLSAADRNIETFGLQLSKGDISYNTTKFRVRQEATTAFEVAFDASMMFPFDSQLPQIYSIASDGMKLGINSLPESTESTTIAVRLAPGAYTISKVGTPTTLTLVELYDKQTDHVCNLMTTDSYRFEQTTSGDVEDRFILRTSRISTSISSITNSGIQVWSQDSHLRVESAVVGSPIQIVDISGMIIYQGTIEAPCTQYSLPSKGIYLVKIAEEITKVSCTK